MIEHRIGADDRPACGVRLGDQQTVKRIFVMPRQQPRTNGVRRVDRSLQEPFCRNLTFPVCEQPVDAKLSKVRLDG